VDGAAGTWRWFLRETSPKVLLAGGRFQHWQEIMGASYALARLCRFSFADWRGLAHKAFLSDARRFHQKMMEEAFRSENLDPAAARKTTRGGQEGRSMMREGSKQLAGLGFGRRPRRRGIGLRRRWAEQIRLRFICNTARLARRAGRIRSPGKAPASIVYGAVAAPFAAPPLKENRTPTVFTLGVVIVSHGVARPSKQLTCSDYI